MIIDRSYRSEFSSWQQIKDEISKKNVHCPDVSFAQLIKDIEEIEHVANKNFFKTLEFELIFSLLNQVRYYIESNPHYMFIDELHQIAEGIRKLKIVLGSERLLPQIFTNFGMFYQFVVTLWLEKYLKIVDVEVRNSPINTDILVNLKGHDIHFHVKDIREFNREERVHDVYLIIDNVLSRKSDARNSDKRLAVVSVEGVPPSYVLQKHWNDLAEKIEMKPQRIVERFKSPDPKMKDDIEVKIELDWRPYNNGVFDSPTASFNNSMRLQQEYNKFEEKVKDTTDQIHVLIAISEDEYNWNEIKKEITSSKLGLVIINIYDEVEKGPFILPDRYKNIEVALNRKVPNISSW